MVLADRRLFMLQFHALLFFLSLTLSLRCMEGFLLPIALGLSLCLRGHSLDGFLHGGLEGVHILGSCGSLTS